MRRKALLEERRNKILQIIRQNQSVQARDMSKLFGVSTETIRKDLIYLEKQGMIRKNYGGAILESAATERAIEPRMRENIERKAAIARRMMNLLPDKGILILDAGSTVYQLAELLVASENTYTIITNSVSIAHLLAGGRHTLFCMGGEIRGSTMSMTGIWAIHALETIKADLAIFGTSGFMSHDGPCAEAFVEADIKRAILKNSRRHIILSDSSKFHMDALVSYCTWDEVDLLITDADASEEALAQLRKRTQVEVVDVNTF